MFRLCLKTGTKKKILVPSVTVEPGTRIMIYVPPVNGSVYIEDIWAKIPHIENGWTELSNITIEEV